MNCTAHRNLRCQVVRFRLCLVNIVRPETEAAGTLGERQACLFLGCGRGM